MAAPDFISDADMAALEGSSSSISSATPDFISDEQMLAMEPTLGSESAAVGGRFLQGAGDLLSFFENLNPQAQSEKLTRTIMSLGGEEYAQAAKQMYPSTAEQVSQLRQMTGTDQEAQTPVGKIAGEIGYFAPGAVIPGGSVFSRMASALGAGSGAGIVKAGDGGEGAQLAAALIGGIAPSALGSLGQKATSVFTPSANRAQQAKQTVQQMVSQIADKDEALTKLQEFNKLQAALPEEILSKESHLPKYFTTAEAAESPGLAALEATFKRGDTEGKVALLANEAAREQARQNIFAKVLPEEVGAAEAGETIRKGLQANYETAQQGVKSLAGEAFLGAEEIPIAAAKRAVTGTLNSLTKDGSTQVGNDFANLVENFRALPAKVDLKTLQNYRSAFGEYASTNVASSKLDRQTARVANAMRSSLDDIITKTVDSGAVSPAQATAWKEMIGARREQGALFEQGIGSKILAKEPYSAGFKLDASKIPDRALATAEEAKDLVTALKQNIPGKKALQDSLLTRIYEKSTDPITGEFSARNFARQTKLIRTVGEEVLTPKQIFALEKIGIDLTSQAKVAKSALKGSAGQSITAEQNSLLDWMQNAATGKGLAALKQSNSLIGSAIEFVANKVTNPELKKRLVQDELTKFILNPKYAEELLSSPAKISKSLSQGLSSALVNAASQKGNISTAARAFSPTPEGSGAGLLSFSPQEAQASIPTQAPAQQVRQPKSSLSPISYQEEQVRQPKTADEWDILLDSIAMVESSNNPKAVGEKTKYGTAKGKYQVLDATGKEYHKKLEIDEPYDPFNEEQQREIASAIIQDYMQMFDGDINKAITAYHTGPGNVKKGIIGPQGKAYLPKVEKVFERLFAKASIGGTSV